MSLPRMPFTSILKWLLIFCIVIQMTFRSQSLREFQLQRTPIWFNIVFKETGTLLSVDDITACLTADIVGEIRDPFQPLQWWRWYKGMIMNFKEPYVLDIAEGKLQNGNKLMLYYAIHGKNQCWTVIKVSGGHMLANCYDNSLRLRVIKHKEFEVDDKVVVDTVGSLIEIRYPGVDGWPLVGPREDSRFPAWW